MDKTIFEQQIDRILLSDIPNDTRRGLAIEKIMLVLDVLSATTQSPNSEQLLSQPTILSPQLEAKKMQTRKAVGIPRDTYLKVLTELSLETKNPIRTTDLKKLFSKKIIEEIENVYAGEPTEFENAKKRFLNGASILSLRKASINDPVRKNLTGSLKNDKVKREIPSKYNLFILVNENGDPIRIGTDRIEWRNLYIRSYQANTNDKEFLLNSNDVN